MGPKAQRLSHVNIQNANLIGVGTAAGNQVLVASASGAAPRTYFVGQQQAAVGFPVRADSPRAYYNQDDGAPTVVTPARGSSQITHLALSASCDDRSRILDPRRQRTAQSKESRTATAAPYSSKRRDGAGHGVLENAFIQQKLSTPNVNEHVEDEGEAEQAGQRTPATISDYSRHVKLVKSSGHSAVDSKIQLKTSQGQAYGQPPGKQSPAKLGQQQYLSYH